MQYSMLKEIKEVMTMAIIRKGEFVIPKNRRQDVKLLQDKGERIANQVEESTKLAKDSLRKLGYDV